MHGNVGLDVGMSVGVAVEGAGVGTNSVGAGVMGAGVFTSVGAGEIGAEEMGDVVSMGAGVSGSIVGIGDGFFVGSGAGGMDDWSDRVQKPTSSAVISRSCCDDVAFFSGLLTFLFSLPFCRFRRNLVCCASALAATALVTVVAERHPANSIADLETMVEY